MQNLIVGILIRVAIGVLFFIAFTMPINTIILKIIGFILIWLGVFLIDIYANWKNKER